MTKGMPENQDRDPEALRDEPGTAADEREGKEREETLTQGEMPYRRPSETPLPEEDTAERIDRLIRALADAENARRRAERSAAEARQYAIGDFARDLLVVLDNLQRALAVSQTGGPGVERAIVEGVRATDRLLQSVIERYGVKKIDSLGAQFDPKLHEAVMVIDDETREPGIIVEVAEDGYLLHDRLLRPARVFVNNPNLKPATNLHGQEPG